MSTYEVYCKHKFVIDGKEYSYDDAEEILKNMEVGDKVTIEHNGAKYVVERVIPNTWWNRSPMYEIRAITPVGEIFVIRRDYSFDVLIDMIMKIRQYDGYVKMYGKYEHPLEEFKDELEEVLTELSRVRGKPYWIFGGNHKKYSAAFRYAIYDENLVREVAERMRKLQLCRVEL